MALKVGLFDSCFLGHASMSLGQENEDELPIQIEWVRESNEFDTIVFTDQRMKEVVDHSARNRVGVLIEPPALRPWHYEDAQRLKDEFRAIFTFDAAIVDGEKFLFYPFGGSYIREWGIFDKSQSVSLITSQKTITEGHRLRHLVAGMFPGQVDIFGQPRMDQFHSKAEPLRPYRFSIVIESERRDWYFTEKLIDCLSQGTIPIYWGCPDIGQFFNATGIISFSSPEELRWILKNLSESAYMSRIEAVRENLEKAKVYRIAEDWIATTYPALLG